MSEDIYAYVTCHGIDATIVPSCGSVPLSFDQYAQQMERPDDVWRCPLCGADASFDDAKFERLHGFDEEEGPTQRAYDDVDYPPF